MNSKISEVFDQVITFKVSEREKSKIIKKIKSKYESKSEAKFKFIDLFAGIGGLRTGFEFNGGECVFSSEWDKYAQQTYFCNYGEFPNGDITKVALNEIPKHDVLLAGFPCQAFSVAGERKGFEDTRGTLFFDVARILESKNPSSFLLENVKGLLNHDGGQTFRVIIETLEQLNYEVHYKVLNTMDYGNTPQTRERLYIVGFHKSKVKVRGFEFPIKKKLTKTISDVLDHAKQDDYFYYNRFDIYPTLKKEILKKDTVYQWRRVYTRENKSNVCPTLTANMGTGGHNVPLIKDDYGIRKLTPRECARFQGFPENFYIPAFMANSHLYKQFGNSVSVPVVKAISACIVEVLEKNKVSHAKVKKKSSLPAGSDLQKQLL